jgi:hypothetical protein
VLAPFLQEIGIALLAAVGEVAAERNTVLVLL